VGAKHLTENEYRRNEKAVLKTIADCDALIRRLGIRAAEPVHPLRSKLTGKASNLSNQDANLSHNLPASSWLQRRQCPGGQPCPFV
jgi:hypothetical protein